MGDKKKTQLGFTHQFIPSNNSKGNSSTLLLLHGTGGNENDLIPIARMLSPANGSILSPRGKVLENGMPRFFRRLSEGVFDLQDLKFRTHELADFIQKCSLHYKFDLNQTIAVGFSNGANIASSILLLRPDVIQGVILFRAMIPLVPNPLPNLSNKKILLSAGVNDPIVSRTETENLYRLFRKTNANVMLKWQQSSHNLIQKDIADARKWISNNFSI